MYYQQMLRRNFLKRAGLLSAGFASLRFSLPEKEKLKSHFPVHNIPEDKNLDPAWVQSLPARGEPTAWYKSKNELRYIGMPVGGLHAGTVYAGGDGRLWLWQIYNQTIEGTHEGIEPKIVQWNDGTGERVIKSRDGAAYVDPAIAGNLRVLEQGFAVMATIDSEVSIKELNEAHWDEIVFRPAYPMATVTYTSKDFPLEVELKIYSPFIPLDAGNSALPATILRLSVKNTGLSPIHVSLLGWMENGVNKISGKQGTGRRVNAVLETVDSVSIFSSFDAVSTESSRLPDSGSMCFTLHQAKGVASAEAAPWPVTRKLFEAPGKNRAETEAPGILVGGISCSQSVAGGQSLNADYSISWHFNNPNPGYEKLVKDAKTGFYYGARYPDAQAVTSYLQKNFTQLTTETESWCEVWNSSTLPAWFMERTFVNIATLATANTYRFANGRFWSWEGVGACPGTCTHVWQYAQAVARIFPELERDLRERVDLGVGFDEQTGAIRFRGEDETRPAIDGQAGTILRFYREHQMSADDSFLRENWAGIKKSVQFMLAQDKNGDGMTDSPMENTLDAVWEGEIAWIVGLCIAAAAAAQAMAVEMNDTGFARVCARYVSEGSRNMEEKLFNGEYFIHRPDENSGRSKLGSYNTCHIDQVYGQSWAFQVGLPRIISREKSVSALRSLWKYNLASDVGPYIKTHPGGRPYALGGEGGMVMNTNPRNEEKPFGENSSWQMGYFNECMSGFEHQVASHLMAEGMVEESLILTRFIHERYHAAKRNPFNEIECSDHYARAMASYGTFISACGYEYHGPKGYIKFAPKWNRAAFRAPFTAAKGWGTFSQAVSADAQSNVLSIKYGELGLKNLAFELPAGKNVRTMSPMLGESLLPAGFKQTGNEIRVSLKKRTTIRKGESVDIKFSF